MTVRRARRDSALPSPVAATRTAAPRRLAEQTDVLRLIAQSAALHDTLDALALFVERELPGARASILLLTPDGQHVSVAAAPSLPAEFGAAVDGESIGPNQGTCGAALAGRRVVITSDIASDPAWDTWREGARAAGLAACWSTPFVGAHDQLLGAFAVYFGERRSPEAADLETLADAGHLAAVAVQQDHSERRLRELARTDALTGLANGNVLLERLRVARVRAVESGLAFGVILIGIDRMSVVNETFGVAAGDELLRMVGRRLMVAAGATATVARMWGDEFVVLVEDLGSLDNAAALAERLRLALTRPFDVDGLDLQGSASVGVATVRPDDPDPDPLRLATTALDRAKSTARGQVSVYDPGWTGTATEPANLVPELRRGLAGDEFALAYQPIVHLASDTVTRWEALLRWTSAQHGPVSPETFVPIAERTGLVTDLGRYALDASFAELRRKQADPDSTAELGIAVNVSGHQLGDESFPTVVGNLLAQHALAPRSVTLEVTEGVLLRSAGVGWRVLSTLRELGVRIAIDDFGTGFSQLSYLRQFHFDEIKIDRSFVADVVEDAQARAIVASIVSLAGALDVETIAEGIERPEQCSLLVEMGCTYGQGYLLGRPRAAI